MFLIDKSRPTSIHDFVFNRNIIEELAFTSIHDNVPHIIISGPTGSGKRTIAKFFLEMMYDQSVHALTKRKYNIHGSSSKKEEIEILQSEYHIVIEPTNTNHDKYILQEIIKEYARHKTFDIFKTNRPFKTILINNIENLAANSQAALRRTMELYAKSCRFIMICNNLSRIFEPLRSRCRLFCVKYPTLEEIGRTICDIAIKENIKLNATNRQMILSKCNNNIKHAIWLLDTIRCHSTSTLPIEKTFNGIVDMIMSVTDPKCTDLTTLFDDGIRSEVYRILITNIKGTEIIISIMDRLLVRITDDTINMKIIQVASEADYNLIHGRRDVMHIDLFVSTVIYLLLHADVPFVPKGKTKSKKK